jgi:hypothetical protein
MLSEKSSIEQETEIREEEAVVFQVPLLRFFYCQLMM